MAKRRSTFVPLERRSRLIFGFFILLTVVGCLWWPWSQLEQLARSGDLDRAHAVARAYLQYSHALRFADQRGAEQLRRFGILKGEKQPRLIRLPAATPAQPQKVPGGIKDFESESFHVFLKHPKEPPRRLWAGNTLLYVQPLRAESDCLACHSEYQPGELLGVASLELNVKERQETLLANQLILVAAAVLVVVLSMVAFYAVFRYVVVRPVQHLKDVADRVSEGDLGIRSEIDTGNELEVLSDALNHMLDEMAKAQADLRAATAARDAKLDDLAKANVALFEANQVKNKFLTTMSHELRTPLNSILGFAQLLSDSPAVAADPKLGRYAHNILSSGRMLLDMINDLLDLAKIEAGRLQVRIEKVSPQDLAEVVCNMVRPMLAETPLKLSCDVDPATPLLLTDGTKVQQILYNLLSNAIKFTAEGEVRLTVRPAPERAAPAAPAATAAETDREARGPRVAFAVIDTGPGIARDEQLRIFEQFTQLDSGYTKRYRGTGLGLSIVKELTGLLGGTVTVESEVGRGSTFTVVLPVDSSAAAGRSPQSEGASENAADRAAGTVMPA